MPQPDFVWTDTLSETLRNQTFDDSHRIEYNLANSTFSFSDTVNLTSESSLVVNVSCLVSNSIGNDTKTTQIRLCSKLIELVP